MVRQLNTLQLAEMLTSASEVGTRYACNRSSAASPIASASLRSVSHYERRGVSDGADRRPTG